MSKKICIICGNYPGENLTAEDRRVRYCEDCGKPVCGFCSELGVCCDVECEFCGNEDCECYGD